MQWGRGCGKVFFMFGLEIVNVNVLYFGWI